MYIKSVDKHEEYIPQILNKYKYSNYNNIYTVGITLWIVTMKYTHH